MNLNDELLAKYVEHGIIKADDKEEIISAVSKTGQSIQEYIAKKYYISAQDELKVLGEYYNMPYADLDMLQIDMELFNSFSFDFMKKHKMIPICRTDEGILVATGNPLNLHSLSAIRTISPEKVDFIYTSSSQIERKIDSISADTLMSNALSDIHNKIDKKYSEGSSLGNSNYTEDTVDNPTVRLVDSIIREAIPLRASDIHIEPFEKVVRVRYRIDGVLYEKTTFPISAYSAICTRLKIMSSIDIAERRIPQDGRIVMKINNMDYDLRVSTLPSVNGEKFVIRILDKTTFNFTRGDLGFTDEENKVVDKMLMRPHGIVLLTGPTGCGKSTTLYSFLKEVNNSEVNVVTVEDPVEYSMEGVTQTQVNTKANMTFATALRSILRQDPDVIMIGEIRDEETAEIAVRAAITGHLVFSTLHTNDATGAIARLEDMGIPEYLISDALVGVIAQRLVKKLCPVCKKAVETNKKEMGILGIESPTKIYHPVGCQYCNNTGYKGRTAVHEIMYVNNALKVNLLETRNPEQLRNVALNNGMVSLWDSCKALVLDGQTSIQELLTLNVE